MSVIILASKQEMPFLHEYCRNILNAPFRNMLSPLCAIQDPVCTRKEFWLVVVLA